MAATTVLAGYVFVPDFKSVAANWPNHAFNNIAKAGFFGLSLGGEETEWDRPLTEWDGRNSLLRLWFWRF